MKNLLFEKGKTNWLAIVLVSSMIGALTAWVIFFVSESILEISAPDSLRNNGRTDGVIVPATMTPVVGTIATTIATGICDRAITGREPSGEESRQCLTAGGSFNCGTLETDIAGRPVTGARICTCACPR